MRQKFITAVVGSAAIALAFPFAQASPQASPQASLQASSPTNLQEDVTPSHGYGLTSNEPVMAQDTSQGEPQAVPSFSDAEFSFEDITILSSGVEPRQVLQIQPEVNAQQQSVIDVDMNGQMTASGRTQTLPNIPTTMTLMTDVTRIDDADNRYIEFEYTDVGVGETSGLPSEALNVMRSQLGQLVGLRGSWVQAPQGAISQLEITIPETMSPVLAQNMQQMAEGMQQMSAPFPTEAIGVGAQWQAPYTASMNGITMRGVAAYELLSHEGDRVSLAATISQQGASSGSNSQGLPPGVNIGVQQTTGEGTIDMDLKQVMPIQSNLEITTYNSFTISNQGNEIPVSMALLINMTLVSE
ncbi:MAG: hypothetical protein F6K09_07640 [Merismopedia sp. SIO2A8]|nr:hypothetical protein [Merismopedia sp. SIO2A8]